MTEAPTVKLCCEQLAETFSFDLCCHLLPAQLIALKATGRISVSYDVTVHSKNSRSSKTLQDSQECQDLAISSLHVIQKLYKSENNLISFQTC